MLPEGLLEKIGFDEFMIGEYNKHAPLLNEKIAPYTKDYFESEKSILDIALQLEQFATHSISKYTVILMFLLDCTGYYLEKCRAKGISEEIFIDNVKDIR